MLFVYLIFILSVWIVEYCTKMRCVGPKRPSKGLATVKCIIKRKNESPKIERITSRYLMQLCSLFNGFLSFYSRCEKFKQMPTKTKLIMIKRVNDVLTNSVQGVVERDIMDF